jgi:hypothetical protein
VLTIGAFVAGAWWGIESAIHSVIYDDGQFFEQLVPRTVDEWWMRSLVVVLILGFASYACVVINRIDRARQEQQRLQKELADALAKALSGFVPICASCKKIREDDSDPDCQASWHSVESYLTRHTGVKLSHGICPACEDELYGERSS